MSDPEFAMEWVVTGPHEAACTGGASEMAGGELSGQGTFADIGVLEVSMSAAWDIAEANPDPSDAEYEPESPDAGGPFTLVLGQDGYPHDFQTDPTGGCGAVVTATGKLVLTDADGDRIRADVTGGETHRLDVAVQGDGIETFIEIDFTGGDGPYADATGSALLHLITHFDGATGAFVIDQVEVMSGGTIRY
ncbi:MAG: hypothetical protein WD336_00010 [Trueperaceae bacterium]